MGVNAFDHIKEKLNEVVGEDIKHVEAKAAEEELEEEEDDPLADRAPPPPPDDRASWEVGNPDYYGRASFDNILKRLSGSVDKKEIVRTRIKKSKSKKEPTKVDEEKTAEGEEKEEDRTEESAPRSLIVTKRRVAFSRSMSVRLLNVLVTYVPLPVISSLSTSPPVWLPPGLRLPIVN